MPLWLPWFREGAYVEAKGEEKPDAITTQMEGTPFEVRRMKPLLTRSANGSEWLFFGEQHGGSLLFETIAVLISPRWGV